MNDINAFLKQQGRYLNSQQLNSIIRVIDKDTDTKISLNDFIEILDPYRDKFYPNYSISDSYT